MARTACAPSARASWAPRTTRATPSGARRSRCSRPSCGASLPAHFELAFFADTGNVVADYADFLHFDGFRHAVGLGLRYELPVGPLRLDLGWNPNPAGDEDDYALHFAIGRAH